MNWQLAACVLIIGLAVIGLIRRFCAFVRAGISGDCTSCGSACSHCDLSPNHLDGGPTVVEIETPVWVGQRN